MKNKIFGSIAILIIATVVAVNVNFNVRKQNNFDVLTLANIEALADEKESDGSYKGTIAECNATTTTETYTAGPGWKFEVGTGTAGKWLFNGEVTSEKPSNYTKETTVTSSKWTGCKPQGDTRCSATSC